jgi:hypothetical protein
MVTKRILATINRRYCIIKFQNPVLFSLQYGIFLCSFAPNKKIMFKILAKINKAVLPSYSKQRLDLAKATKLQKAIIAWRYYVTINALEKK